MIVTPFVARRPLAVGALVAASLAAIAVPTPQLGAQQGAASAGQPAQTHTVRPGDTLWDIARRYLGDPFLWQEVFRVNTDVVEDPHKIYPGEVLRIPEMRPALARRGGDSTAVANADAEGAVPADDLPVETGRAADESPTVFASAAVRQTQSPRTSSVAVMAPTSVRRGEYEAAPMLVTRGPSGTGRFLQTVDQSGTLQQADLDIRRLQVRERIAIAPPAGKPAEVGDVYVAFRSGGSVDGRDVLVPTALVRVEDAAPGRAPTGSIVRTFESVTTAHRLMPYVPIQVDTVAAVRVSGGRPTKVLGIYGDDLLPSLQNYVFFPLTPRDGVRPGDLVEIYRATRREGSTTVPDVQLATVALVRVTDGGSTGIIVRQHSTGRFQAGSPARVIAKLP